MCLLGQIEVVVESAGPSPGVCWEVREKGVVLVVFVLAVFC